MNTLEEFEKWYPAFVEDYYQNIWSSLQRPRERDRYLAVQGFLAGIKAAQQSMHPTREVVAQKSNIQSKKSVKSARG